MGPLDKQNLLKSHTSKKVKAANVPMKNISQKTMMVRLSRSVNTPIFQIGKIISFSSKNELIREVFSENVSVTRLEFEFFFPTI